MREQVISARSFLAAVTALFVGLSPAVGQQPSGGGSSAPPQPPPKAKSQLEDWLEKSLAHHPDIKVAEAKLRTAAAELERARSLVTQQVLSLHHGIEAQKILVEKARFEMDRIAELVKKAVISQAELGKARSDLIAAEAKLAELQGQVNHLIGRDRTQTGLKALGMAFLDLDGDGKLDVYVANQRLVRSSAKSTLVRGPMAERIRKALDRKMTYRHDAPVVDDVMEALQKEFPDLVIQIKGNVGKSTLARVNLQEVPLGGVLQLLEDSLRDYRIVVREYGILLAPEKELPQGAVPLVEFWKGSADKDANKKPSGPPQK